MTLWNDLHDPKIRDLVNTSETTVVEAKLRIAEPVTPIGEPPHRFIARWRDPITCQECGWTPRTGNHPEQLLDCGD